MTLIAVSQRVAVEPRYGERRDCLDQMWTRFLAACGLVPLPVPNVPEMVVPLFAAVPITGILLITGGNDLAACGGDVPERDATEEELLRIAEERGLPLLGVCRGMQIIQHRFGTPLRNVTGHVAQRHSVVFEGAPVEVNSYHNFGADETCCCWSPRRSPRRSDRGRSPRREKDRRHYVASRTGCPLFTARRRVFQDVFR